MTTIRRHRLAYAGFALFFVAWATTVPMGEVRSGAFQWALRRADGQRVLGMTKSSQQGWGMPAGTIVRGENVWSAEEETPSGMVPLPVTDAMKAEVLAAFPEAAEPEGFSLSLGNVFPPPPLLVVIFFGLSCVWWAALLEWRWLRGRWGRNALYCAALSLWPWLFLTTSGLAYHDRRDLSPVVQQLVSARVAIAGTALVLTLGLAVHMGLRHRAEDGSADPDAR